MPKRFFLFFVFSFLVLIFSSCVKKIPEKIEWNTSLEESFKLANEEKKKLLLDFYRKDCKWCKRLDDSTFTDREVISLSLDFVFVKIDAKKDSLLVEEYKVSAYPTVILLKSSGEEIERIVGYLSPREFFKNVKSYLLGRGTLADLEKKLKKDSTDIVLLLKIGEKYMDRKRHDEAKRLFRKINDLDSKNYWGKTDSALFNLAYIHYREKEYKEAIAKFQNLSKDFPESGLRLDAEEYIPYIYEKMGDTTKALKLYEKFLKEHPKIKESEKEWVEKRIKKLKGKN